MTTESTPQRRFFDAVRWSFTTEIVVKIAQPVTFVVLAGLLSPGDFGIAAAAYLVAALSSLLWEAGLSKAVIQTTSDIDRSATVAFWINLALGVVIATGLVAISDTIGDILFHEPQVGPVLKLMALHVLIGSTTAVQIALLQKRMDFATLFRVRLVAGCLPPLISIPLALSGAGYWAIVAGWLSGQIAQASVLWIRRGWRPGPPPSLAMLTASAPLLRFSFWVLGSALIGWFFNWGDTLIVGQYFSSDELGVYRTGVNLSTQVFTLAFFALNPVVFSHFSSLQKDRRKLVRDGSEMVRMVAALSIPLGFAGYALSEPLVAAVLSPKWSALGPVLGVLCLAQGLSWSVGLNPEIYRAAGRPALAAGVALLMALIYLAGYQISAGYGFEAFLWSRLALATLGIIGHLAVLVVFFDAERTPIVRQLFLSLGFGFLIVISVEVLLQYTGEGAIGILAGSTLSLALALACMVSSGHHVAIRQFLVRTKSSS